MEVRIMKVNELKMYEFEGNPVPDMTGEEYKELMEDIKRKGVIQPLLVFEKGGDIYVYDGRHRLQAAMEAGVEDVSVIIRDIEEEQAQIEMVRTALYRRHLDPGAKTKMVAWLIDKMGIKIKEKEGQTIRGISKKVGAPKSTVERAIKYKQAIEQHPELEGEPITKVIKKAQEKEKPQEEKYQDVIREKIKNAIKVCEACNKFPCQFIETMIFNIEKAGCGREMHITEPPTTAIQEVIEEYKRLQGIPQGDKGWNKVFYPRFTKAAKVLIENCDDDVKLAKKVLHEIAGLFRKKGWEWTLNTAIKPNILSIAYGRVKYGAGNRGKYKADVELE